MEIIATRKAFHTRRRGMRKHFTSVVSAAAAAVTFDSECLIDSISFDDTDILISREYYGFAPVTQPPEFVFTIKT